MVLGSEVGVDVFKHAFMSKFNALRPKVYRGFFRQLCREHVKLAQSYKLHRVVGFVPLAPAAVLIKALPGVYRTLTPETAAGAFDDFADDASSAGSGSGSFLAELDFARIARHLANPLGTRSGRELVGFALAFLALLAFKLAFGVALHWFGARTLERLRRQGKGARRGRAEGATEGPEDAAADADRANPWRNPNTRAMFGPKPGTVDGTSKTFEDAGPRWEGDGRRGNENGRDGNGGREWNGFNGNGNERVSRTGGGRLAGEREGARQGASAKNRRRPGARTTSSTRSTARGCSSATVFIRSAPRARRAFCLVRGGETPLAALGKTLYRAIEARKAVRLHLSVRHALPGEAASVLRPSPRLGPRLGRVARRPGRRR